MHKSRSVVKLCFQCHIRRDSHLVRKKYMCVTDSRRDPATRFHLFGKRVLSGIFIGYVLIAGGIWTGAMLVADVSELENLDASEIRARRLNAKEVLMSKKGQEFVFPFADGSVKLAGRDQVLRESTFIQDHSTRGQEQNDVLQGESDGSLPSDHQTDDMEAPRQFLENFWESDLLSSPSTKS